MGLALRFNFQPSSVPHRLIPKSTSQNLLLFVFSYPKIIDGESVLGEPLYDGGQSDTVSKKGKKKLLRYIYGK